MILGLAKSALSFAGALPTFGTQQMLRLLDPSTERLRDTSSAFHSVQGQLQAQLDPKLLGAFQIADRLQRDLIDLSASPSVFGIVGREVAQRMAEGTRVTTHGNTGTMIDEITNKTRVFFLVIAASRILGVPLKPPLDLPTLVRRSYSLDDFRALWAIEGVGHDYTDSYRRMGETAVGILSVSRQPDLPTSSLLMLHAGLGLAFSQRLLVGVTCQTPESELRTIVTEFLNQCSENSRPGSVGAAWESLGLETRSFHGARLTRMVDRVLREVSPELVPYFWHGVGRAIYFSVPLGFLPYSDWQMFETARDLAPDEAALTNAWAGLAWAFTLVNQKKPRVMAELLIGPYGEELTSNPGFANGVSSAMIARFDATPAAPFIKTFCSYEPEACGPGAERLWSALVRRPCERALDRYYPLLKSQDRLGEVFHYQDLDRLTGSG